ncbi:MAG: hypothetical protein V4723_07885 [Pseudomonadota bacterium]
MKTANINRCLHGAASYGAIAIRSEPRAHSPARRPALASDAISKISAAPRLTSPLEGQASRLSGIPRVLHIDADPSTALVVSTLLAPEAHVTCAHTMAQAHALLSSEQFALVVLDPSLPDGDAASLLPLLGSARLLVYSAVAPAWHAAPAAYLAKPWTSARQLWMAVAGLLGISYQIKTGA